MGCVVKVIHGPTINISWTSGMNAQQAIEEAYTKEHTKFNCSLQFYGTLGYLVSMINETYDSYVRTADPYYYWEFMINGTPAPKGIDQTILNDNDIISFEFQLYTKHLDSKSTIHKKHASTIN